MHLKFLNAIASYAQTLNLNKEHEHSAFRFHQDMLASGIERILSVRQWFSPHPSKLIAVVPQIARKASSTYYPTLHLEIARYVAAAGLSGADIPWSLSRLIGPPPTAMRKQSPVPPPPSRPKTPNRSTPTTPTKQRGPPPSGFAGYSSYAAPSAQPSFMASNGATSGRPSGERGRESERQPAQSRKVTPMFG